MKPGMRGGGGGGGGGEILAFTNLRVFIVVHSRRIAVFLICYIFIDFSPQEHFLYSHYFSYRLL